MNRKNQFFPSIVFHPGETLAEKLDELNMGRNEFAIRTDKPEKTIIAVIKGESSITPDMAIRFEHVLKIPAYFWLKRQADYDEYIIRERRRSELENTIEWAMRFPLSAMIKNQWIPDCTNKVEKTGALLDFFELSNHIAWEKYYLQQASASNFRISLASAKDPYAISAWLRRGEIQSLDIQVKSFSAETFKSILPTIKKLMYEEPPHYFKKMQELCSGAGVRLVYTPCLPKVPASGSTRWYKGNPLIQMTGRYNRNDSFWFSFFHEAGHILLHNKYDIFLEKVEYTGIAPDKAPDKAPEKEKEADDFAIKWTLSKAQEKEIIASYLQSTSLSETVAVYSRKFETNPAIIVGRLQHVGVIGHGVGNEYLSVVELEDDHLI